MFEILNRAAENLRSEGWDEEAAAVDAAADRIEHFEAALREIADCVTLPAQNDSEMREIARKALKGGEHG